MRFEGGEIPQRASSFRCDTSVTHIAHRRAEASRALIDAGEASLVAAGDRDVERIFDLSEDILAPCTGCHEFICLRIDSSFRPREPSTNRSALGAGKSALTPARLLSSGLSQVA